MASLVNISDHFAAYILVVFVNFVSSSFLKLPPTLTASPAR